MSVLSQLKSRKVKVTSTSTTDGGNTLNTEIYTCKFINKHTIAFGYHSRHTALTVKKIIDTNLRFGYLRLKIMVLKYILN